MPLPLVIVNPASALGSTATAWPRIASELRSHFGPFQVSFTERAGDGLTLAAEAAERGVELIIACGGDGTISEVANGILNSGKMASLGILPSGTGGDFRKTLGLSAHVRESARVLREGHTRQIDVGRVTFIGENGTHQSRYFLGVASFGMSAQVVKSVKNEESQASPGQGAAWYGGRLSYGVAMLREALRSPATGVVVQLEDEQERYLKVAALCVANARYFGGGMKIAPKASLDDGKFDIIAIGDLGAFKILTNAPRIYTGAHLSMQQVEYTLAKRISARAADQACEVLLEVDGELPGRLPATFQVVPRALRLRCPRMQAPE
jgi:YegS/Rv2252/BmrU family lipid kinase